MVDLFGMATPGEKRQNINAVEAVRKRMRLALEESGLSQEEIGVKMGLARKSARKAVSRLLNAESYDPRLSTLKAFADAIGKPLRDFV
jgi:transcriptional regulator with XRE-family HTH domain